MVEEVGVERRGVVGGREDEVDVGVDGGGKDGCWGRR